MDTFKIKFLLSVFLWILAIQPVSATIYSVYYNPPPYLKTDFATKKTVFKNEKLSVSYKQTENDILPLLKLPDLNLGDKKSGYQFLTCGFVTEYYPHTYKLKIQHRKKPYYRPIDDIVRMRGYTKPDEYDLVIIPTKLPPY